MSRIETAALQAMLSTPPTCDLDYIGCQGAAIDRGPHPTGEALGEDGWAEVWYCGHCAWQAARDS